MFENHVMRQKHNTIYKSKYTLFFLSRKFIVWVGSKAGREVNGHRAKIQGPVYTGMHPRDKRAVLGTTRRGQR